MKPLLVIATHNLHKLKEIRKILGPLPFHVAGLDRFKPYSVRETGKTLEANALLKARAGVRRTGQACLSDDTGLEVKVLRGAPGVYSARYAGPGCSFEDNNRKLLRALKGLPLSKRTAVFRCAVALATPGGKTRVFGGRCPGRIVPEARGKNGFGYDPVFEPAGTGKTFAEMPLKTKNALSHRAKAFKKAAAFLRKNGLALTLLLALLSARSDAALSGPQITTSDYRVDVGHAVAVGSTEHVGKGGADVAIAHGAGGLGRNPAAVVARLPGGGDGFNWDGVLSSFAVGGKDFDNNGSEFSDYRKHVVVQLGGLVQPGDWGFGLLGVSQQYEVETAGRIRDFEFTQSLLVAGKRLEGGRFNIGAGLRIAAISMTPDSSSRKVLDLSSVGLSLGGQWAPEGPWRFGAVWHGPIREDPKNAPAQGSAVTVDGLVIPRGVTLPSALAGGLAYESRGAKPWTLTADLHILGKVEEGVGVESFLEQRVQRSGRRATLSPRLGAEWGALPGRMRLRAGAYREPSRFTGVPGRTHGTAGFELRLFRMPFFADRRLSLGYALDAASRYMVHYLSVGFWH